MLHSMRDLPRLPVCNLKHVWQPPYGYDVSDGKHLLIGSVREAYHEQ